jgi:hypothetical protein
MRFSSGFGFYFFNKMFIFFNQAIVLFEFLFKNRIFYFTSESANVSLVDSFLSQLKIFLNGNFLLTDQ